jgi:hypothetical protein
MANGSPRALPTFQFTITVSAEVIEQSFSFANSAKILRHEFVLEKLQKVYHPHQSTVDNSHSQPSTGLA